MIEQLKTFRSSIQEDQLMNLMDKIADFGDEVAVEFPHIFPELPVDEYRRTEVWHMLVGSTVPQGYLFTESHEVTEWMEDKIQTLIDSF